MTFKKLLSGCLCTAMLFGTFTATTYAEETPTENAWNYSVVDESVTDLYADFPVQHENDVMLENDNTSVYADEQDNVNDDEKITDDDTLLHGISFDKERFGQEFENFFRDEMDSGNKIYYYCETQGINLSETYVYSESDFEKQCKNMYDFFVDIDEFCRKNGSVCSCNSKKSDNKYIIFKLDEEYTDEYLKSLKTNRYITVSNNHINILGNTYDVENPHLLIEYIEKKFPLTETEQDYGYQNYVVWTQEINDNILTVTTARPKNTKKYELLEMLNFDVELTDDFYCTAFNDVADSGETVHCTVEYWFGGSIFILRLDGSKGEREFALKVTNGNMHAPWNVRTLNFETNSIIEDGKMIESFERGERSDRIIINGKVEDEEKGNLTMTYDFSDNGLNTGLTDISVPGEITGYEFYGTKSQLDNGKTIHSLFSFPEKEEYLEMIRNMPEIPEQDPERYETLMKGTEIDGSEVDYNINFVMEIPVNLTGSALPDWYKALGNNVKMIIMGITNITDGKESANDYTMIRFKGNKNEQWFTRSQTEFELSNNNDEYLTASTTYNSLISFDGYKRIRNTVEYDSMEATINYTNDDKMDLYSVSVKVGLKEAEFMADEIKYIGGGKARYDKLW